MSAAKRAAAPPACLAFMMDRLPGLPFDFSMGDFGQAGDVLVRCCPPLHS